VNPSYDALLKLLQSRHSCRDFAPRPLDAKVLEALRAAFSLAPQAGGARQLSCSFVTDPAALRELADAGERTFAQLCSDRISSAFAREEMRRYGENFFWFGDAPALAAITCRKPPAFLQAAVGDKATLLWGGELSCAMAVFALLLAVQTLGLGACCLTGPLSVWQEMENRLALPKHDSLVLLVALGYKKDEA
jgi:nitroreductase